MSKENWLSKLMTGHGKRTENAKVDALASYKAKLKGLVYDDDLVAELAPVFAALHGTDGFDKVVELLETKETQIQAISGGEWFEQETGKDEEEFNNDESDKSGEEEENLTAEQILENKYKVTE